MSTASKERIDQLALVWLLVPRKASRVSNFAAQLKHVANGADEPKRLAGESIARLRHLGLIQPGNLLALTEEGRRSALETLGVARLPSLKKPLEWAKKILLLRSMNVDPTPAALNTAGQGAVLAARFLARQHQLDRKLAPSATKVMAVLARRALGLDDASTFTLDDAFSAAFLRETSLTWSNGQDTRQGNLKTALSTAALKLGECKLPEFAHQVTDAARSSVTGRWHDAVFISHVWDTLRARGDVGITFDKFQRRLVEAHQADLLELSRADLVDAMPSADVTASETIHSGARFHFVRLEQLAS